MDFTTTRGGVATAYPPSAGRTRHTMDDTVRDVITKASAASIEVAGAPPTGEYLSVRQIFEQSTETPDWLLAGYVARGAITEVIGKIKWAGKTTLVLDWLRSIMAGTPWAGCRTQQTKVVYLSEQNPATLRIALERAGIDADNPNLKVRFRADFRGAPWALVVADAVACCREFGAGLLVIDTIAKLSGIRSENEAADWTDAMEPPQDAAHAGLAVVSVRHAGKAQRDVADAGRGSSAGSGDADIVLSLRRPEGNTPTSRRILEGLSRYSETRDQIVIDLSDQGYVYLGVETDVARADALRLITDALANVTDAGLSYDELGLIGDEADPKVNRKSIERGMKELLSKGLVTRTGRGVRNNPHRFRLTASLNGPVAAAA